MTQSIRLLIAIVLATVFLGPRSMVNAQVVQLPTYRVFQMPLNVVVPDRGTAVIGGTNYSSAARSTRGLPLLGPTSRRQTYSRGSNSVSVSATIIDHREWDAAVLAEAGRRRRASPKTPNQLAAERMTAQIRPVQPARRSAEELAAGAQQKDRLRQTRQETEAMALIRHGHECLSKGQAGAARIFFRTAMRQSSGSARLLAQQQLAAMTRR